MDVWSNSRAGCRNNFGGRRPTFYFMHTDHLIFLKKQSKSGKKHFHDIPQVWHVQNTKLTFLNFLKFLWSFYQQQVFSSVFLTKDDTFIPYLFIFFNFAQFSSRSISFTWNFILMNLMTECFLTIYLTTQLYFIYNDFWLLSFLCSIMTFNKPLYF